MDLVTLESSQNANLASLLVARGKLSEQDLERAQQIQAHSGGTIEQVLIRLGMASEKDIAQLLAERYSLPLVENYPEEPVLEDEISLAFLKEFHLIPLHDDGEVLAFATADPGNEYVLQSLKLATGRDISLSIGVVSEIEAAFERLYGAGRSAMGQIVEGADADFTDITSDSDDVDRLRDMASEAPVIRIVNLLFTRALEARASDIHIEPFERELLVRYRIDGVLQKAESPPIQMASAVISRLKILSKLNIAERRVPQDGRIQLKISGKTVDLRVSTVPTLHGESVVMRILDKESINLDLDAIGLSETVLHRFKAVLDKPNGIFLVTGPTGSGKTTTLYSALSRINTDSRKILTVEDPVEYQLEGINQIQVATKVGLDFATSLRAIVRQDPDVIMIGEMRDKETAGIAIQSALTGHIVLSTLHTNSAASGITRMLDMGLEDYLITSTVNAIMAQRLVRVLCQACKTEQPVSEEEIRHLGVAHLVENMSSATVGSAVGCDDCNHSGYHGRMGIHELLLVDDDLRQLILEHASAEKIQSAARASGMLTMYEDGMVKALAGHTSMEEVLRVAQAEWVS